MIQETTFVGIDVAKARLDVFIGASGRSVAVDNTPKAIAGLIRHVRHLQASHGPVRVGLEASGGYERALITRLHAAGLTVYLLDPAQVRAFARAMKQHAKTDRIDAIMIAGYLQAAIGRLTPLSPDPARRRLAQLLAHRRRLVTEAATTKGQIDLIDEPVVRRMMAARLRSLAQAILVLDKTIRQRIAESATLARKAALLTRVKGVGPVLTATLLADLPELGTITAKAAAALVGVAPHARQSGTRNRPGRCSGGRKQVRDVLYMAALSAIKANDRDLDPFYRRLRHAGKPFKVAIIAAMRKLITKLNAILRDDFYQNANA